MRRYLIPIIIAIPIIGVILANLSRRPGKRVRVEKVTYRAIIQKVTGSGSLRAKRQVEISSQIIGQVKRIYVREGQLVHKGDLLLKLDDISYRAEFKEAQAQLEDARRNFNRKKQLHERRLIPDEELEKAKLALRVAESRFELARDRLARTEIRSPITGRVLSVDVETGETVLVGTMNNPGTVLFTIADLSQMIAEIEVGETEIPKVKVGQRAIVRVDALPDTSFPGRVVKVGYMPIKTMTTLERTTDFEVEIEIENPGLLRPGMSAEAEIMTRTRDHVLTIPIQAIAKRRKGMETITTVFLYQDGRAIKRRIKTGLGGDQEVEVIEGLKDGDEIITGPYRILAKLKDGDRVVKER
ncbi:hypothetical protein DRP53_02040 [candidate division WOR-3 bacterium]|uniref:Efflux RND transporter periplasmic adaptor subunit n=1 Tax=candidate division WOR-3 bacterium TaxID=2052148 RepID=A0A660SKK1_UNCW3|nr:MAG: hypothetical protein DRP53_02040 [candidate division WOR-3 bacterium]